MLKCLLLGSALAAAAMAQNAPSAVDFANLREDVRGLTQRVSELTLKLEQLERENQELRQRVTSAGSAYATATQLNQGLADVERSLKAAIATSKSDTLAHVATQMEKLARDTNAVLDSLAKALPPAAGPTFSGNFSKEGIHYTVEKGDTLAEIARKTGARAADIINANKLADPDRLVVGQTLFIPGGK